jgi:hypothetical protein
MVSHKARPISAILIALTLLAGAFLSVCLSNAQATGEVDFIYTVREGNASVTGYAGPGGAVVIPETLGGYPVVAIEATAFDHDSAHPLLSLFIPENVTYIAPDSFEECYSMRALNVDANNSHYTSLDGVLYDKSITNLLRWPTSKTGAIFGSPFVVPQSVVHIADGAFRSGLHTTPIVLPSGLESIGNRSFSESSLREILIPAGVISIGHGAFTWCSYLHDINVSSANPFYFSAQGMLCDRLTATLLQCPMGKEGALSIPSTIAHMDAEALMDCWRLTSITVPASVISIGERTFKNCLNAQSIVLTDSIAHLPQEAFLRCSELRTVVLPDHLEDIGARAFEKCGELRSITIPANVSSIGEYAFADCTLLTEIAFLGVVAPTEVGGQWINGTSTSIRGYAPVGSNFPAPGAEFHGLLMEKTPIVDTGLVIALEIGIIALLAAAIVLLLRKR